MPTPLMTSRTRSTDTSEPLKTKFIDMFGANGPAVKDLVVRAGTLSDKEVKALAARWRPSMDFLYAQSQAWKTARKLHLEKAAEIVYNAANESISHANPDWQAAGNVVAHAALGKALAGRMAPVLVARLVEAWDATIATLPAAALSADGAPKTTKVRMRARSAPQTSAERSVAADETSSAGAARSSEATPKAGS